MVYLSLTKARPLHWRGGGLAKCTKHVTGVSPALSNLVNPVASASGGDDFDFLLLPFFFFFSSQHSNELKPEVLSTFQPRGVHATGLIQSPTPFPERGLEHIHTSAYPVRLRRYADHRISIKTHSPSC